MSWSIQAQMSPFDLREAIALSIEQLKVAPISVNSLQHKELSAGDHSIPVRVYYPNNDGPLPILFHIHGGPWVAGNLDTHDNICRRLAVETKTIVIAIDYRRPPENRYPAALEDCMFVLNWIKEHEDKLNGNGELYLIGDSAGGGLVPSVCHQNLTAETPVDINGQILINPATDLSVNSPAYELYGTFIDWYINKNVNKNLPTISPLFSTKFNAFPKSIIVVSENDLLKSDGVRFHQKIKKYGNLSTLYEMKEMGHFGPLWAGNSQKVNAAFEFVVSEFKKWLL